MTIPIHGTTARTDLRVNLTGATGRFTTGNRALAGVLAARDQAGTRHLFSSSTLGQTATRLPTGPGATSLG